MPDDPASGLIGLEHARCAAISAGDTEALGRLLGDDLTHTHTSGVTQDKATYLAAVGERPRETTRGDDLRVRVYGDAALMTGTVKNTFPATEPGADPRVVEIQALQVWIRQPDGWKQVAYASSGRPG